MLDFNIIVKMDNYSFFWQSGSPFSQWHSSDYTLDGINFCCCEQGMMYYKAKLFDPDSDIKDKILGSSNPKRIKELGRQVRYFDEKTWKKHRETIVYRNNLAKFTQNKSLRTALLNTGDKILVEASPYDRIWGIGMHERDAKKVDPKFWKGLNLLGFALTDVKKEIKKQKDDYVFNG